MNDTEINIYKYQLHIERTKLKIILKEYRASIINSQNDDVEILNKILDSQQYAFESIYKMNLNNRND